MLRASKLIIVSILLMVISLSPILADGASYFGDVRFRYEIDDKSSKDDQRDRQRIRARLGLKYSMNNVVAGIRFATNSSSIQSPHHTLGTGDASDNTKFGLDRAFISMNILPDSKLTLGKAGANWWQQNEIFIDEDLSPEGIAFTQSLGGLKLNLARYLVQEDGWTGTFSDTSLTLAQGVYSGDFGAFKATVAGGIGMNDFNNRNITTVAAQFKMGKHTAGLDYFQSDAEEDNTGLIVMFRTMVVGYKFRFYYYDVAGNATLDGKYSQDNFPNSVGFSGYRLQVGFKLFENVSTDVRYYAQTMDADEVDVSRFQVNFNVKLQ